MGTLEADPSPSCVSKSGRESKLLTGYVYVSVTLLKSGAHEVYILMLPNIVTSAADEVVIWSIH